VNTEIANLIIDGARGLKQYIVCIERRAHVLNKLEQNKQNAIAFYTEAYLGAPRAAVEKYVGDEYIQHNPLVGDGKAAFIAYFEAMHAQFPDKRIDFVRAIAQDDLVALHTHQQWPGGDSYVTMDFFRFDEKGRIVEHWDAIQQIPECSANGNTMY